MSCFRFEVRRDDLEQYRVEELPAPESLALKASEAVIRVDHYAFTANNITYGVVGEMIGYWQFFPAQEGWGVIPVWGVGTVLQAGNSGLETGQRYYGYFPMASYLVVEPGEVSSRGFTDTAAHRTDLPVVYNQYVLMTEDNGFSPGYDDHQMVYRPLFTTAFVIDDYLRDNDLFGAEDILLGSASSKTALCTAHRLRRGGNFRVIGLTSQGNKSFVEGTGAYNQVLTYDEVKHLDARRRAAFVDMSGSGTLLAAIHHHYGDNLVCSCGVGVTHYDDWGSQDTTALPGARPAMFFAPDQVAKRNAEWGPAVFQQRLNEAWLSFLEVVDDWIAIDHPQGLEGATRCYNTVRQGASPERAFVVTL